MADDRNERIRHRAYEIWEREGRHEGKHDEHWHRAAREIEGEAKPPRGKESDAKPAKGEPQPSKRSPGKGEPSDTAAKRGSGEGVKSSSGRVATKQAATKQKDPSDKRAGKAAERGSDEATPGRKPRKSDAAIKAANNRTGRE
jgi:hypothetical protein